MASRTFVIVKSPPKFKLMVAQYDREELTYRQLEFTLEDGSKLCVKTLAYEHARSGSDEWNFIGIAENIGVICGNFSTATGKGWARTVEGRHRSILELYPDKPDVAVAAFSADATFFGQTKVKIVYRSNSFKGWFNGLVEQEPRRGELKPFVLPKAMSDSDIFAQLGGQEKAVVSLAQVWALLERQPSGEEGELLVDNYLNIFYVKDANDFLHVVNVFWRIRGWHVHAGSLDIGWWDRRNRVFFEQLQPAGK